MSISEDAANALPNLKHLRLTRTALVDTTAARGSRAEGPDCPPYRRDASWHRGRQYEVEAIASQLNADDSTYRSKPFATFNDYRILTHDVSRHLAGTATQACRHQRQK